MKRKINNNKMTQNENSKITGIYLSIIYDYIIHVSKHQLLLKANGAFSTSCIFRSKKKEYLVKFFENILFLIADFPPNKKDFVYCDYKLFNCYSVDILL